MRTLGILLALGTGFTHPSADARVFPAYHPLCELPAGHIAHGHVLSPESSPWTQGLDEVDPVDLAGAVDQFRSVVVERLDRFAANGDTAIAEHEMCVGLWVEPDLRPNSIASSSVLLLVGAADLFTMGETWGESRGAAIEFTVLHELSHNLQYLHDIDFGDGSVRLRELHADCSAAYLMSVDDPTGLDLVTRELTKAEAFRIGDDQVASPQHHGTPDERRAAVDFGWTAGAMARLAGAGANTSGAAMTACAASYALPG